MSSDQTSVDLVSVVQETRAAAEPVRFESSSTGDGDLEHAAMIVAEIVRQLGETYWPILARLEKELDARDSRAKRLARFRRPLARS